jgi:hypothetical protein
MQFGGRERTDRARLKEPMTNCYPHLLDSSAYLLATYVVDTGLENRLLTLIVE